MKPKVAVENVKKERDPVEGKKLIATHWDVFLKNEEIQTLKKKMVKVRDARGDWAKVMYTAMFKSLKYNAKAKFDINRCLSEFQETMIAMADKLKEVMKFDETPKQRGINEFGKGDAMAKDVRKKNKG